MGTFSRRPLSSFGMDFQDKIEDFRSNVGQKIGESETKADVKRKDFTRHIDKVTAALPATTWLLLAGASIVGSLGLKIGGRHSAANFVATWVPTFLILGLYTKIVNVAGSDRTEFKR